MWEGRSDTWWEFENQRSSEYQVYSSSSVLNHPTTWGFALIWETPICQNMSKDVTCRSGLRCLFHNCNLWSSAKLRGFRSAFWDGRTYATLSGMSHCHTIHLRSKSLALSIRVADRGEAEALRRTSRARRLGWCGLIGWWLVSRFYLLFTGSVHWTDLIPVKHDF